MHLQVNRADSSAVATEPASWPTWIRDVRPQAVAALVAGLTFWIAYEDGSFGVGTWTTVALAVWWSLALAVVLDIVPLARPRPTAVASSLLLLAFAGLAGASSAWGASSENAVSALDRALLYAGVFAVGALATRSTLGRWCDGLAAGLTLTALAGLASRLVPGLAPANAFAALPAGEQRLSWPVGYWNGLAVLAATSALLLLRPALAARNAFVRGLALAPVPALAVTLYLTSSRTGAATALVGLFGLIVLAPCRTGVLAALGIAGVGSAVALAITVPRDAIITGPFTSAAAAREGHGAAFFIAAVCIVTGLAWGVASELARRHLRLPRRADTAVLIGLIVLVLAGAAAAHPVRVFQNFKSTPQVSYANPAFVQKHLLSTSGNGRWPLWTAAVHEFTQHPVLGGGAGSFEAFWNRTRDTTLVVQDPHSLYLQALAELGAVGLVLILAAILTALAIGVVRTLRSTGEHRLTLSTLVAASLTFAVAVGTDWMWQLPVVAIVGMLSLGLLTSRDGWHRARGVDASAAMRIAFVGLTIVVLALETIPLLANHELGRSKASSAANRPTRAVSAALAARDLEPWAASPYLQLALLEERSGRLVSARGWLHKAIDRSPDDWSLYVAAARIETKQGAIEQARRSLARAAELNPLGVSELSKG